MFNNPSNQTGQLAGEVDLCKGDTLLLLCMYIIYHAKCWDRFMAQKRYGKYSEGSDAWLWRDLQIQCDWQTWMRAVDPHGYGQCEKRRQEGQVPIVLSALPFILTYLQAQNILPLCSCKSKQLFKLFLCMDSLCPLSKSEIVYFWGWIKKMIEEEFKNTCSEKSHSARVEKAKRCAFLSGKLLPSPIKYTAHNFLWSLL